MEQELLRKLQLTLLNMLKDIDYVCKRNNIKYWLDSGTLLGAIRHHGFIPWDDDLDIGMLRNDYDLFMRVAQTELGDGYFVQNWHSDLNYGYSFGKVIKNNTLYKIPQTMNSHNRDGFFIDIFPFDSYPEKKPERIIQKIELTSIKGMIKYKCGYDMRTGRSIRQRIIYMPFELVSTIFNKELLIRLYEQIVSRYNHENTAYYFGCGACAYGKYIFKESWLGKLSEQKFEDGYFPCPDDYDSWLTMAYGEYMKLPPKDKRDLGHGIIEISFDVKKDYFNKN